MTDDLARDLETVGVPALPNDYAALRSLIQSLPPPLPPEIRSAMTGAVSAADPGMTAASQITSSLAGAPIGTESGAVVGVYPSTFPYNLLKDPAWEGATGVALSGTEALFARGVVDDDSVVQPTWYGGIVSGSFASTPSVTSINSRYEGSATGNSRELELDMRPSAAGTHEVMIRSRAVILNGALGTYLVGAVRLNGMKASAGRQQVTAVKVIVELYNETMDEVVAASTWVDPNPSGPGIYPLNRVLSCAYNPANNQEEFDTFQLRVRYQITTTGATTGWLYAYLAEPRIAWNSTQQPPPFTPLVGGWAPGRVASVASAGTAVVLSSRLASDVYDRFTAEASGDLLWGPGNAPVDVTLERQGPGALKIYAPNGDDESLYIGDDSILFDVDQENTLGLKGTTDQTVGALILGGNRNTRLYTNTAGVLVFDTNGSAYATDVQFHATSGEATRVMVIGGSGQNAWFESALAGDTNPRMTLDGSTLSFGPGNAGVDTQITRSAYQALSINAYLTLGSGVQAHHAEMRDADNPFIDFSTGSTQDYGARLIFDLNNDGFLEFNMGSAGDGRAGTGFKFNGPVHIPSHTLFVGSSQVVTSRRTGWTAPTGTAQRGTFATDSVSLINLARAVKALIDDLTTHGLIGA